ncbi:MAG: hypothetical protein ACLFWB_05075, partial [Armatimonadota bacterium]
MSVRELAAMTAGKTVMAVGPLYSHRIVRVTVKAAAPDHPVGLKQAEEIIVAGGAGRLGRMLQTWGATVELVGCIGQDEAGRTLSGIIHHHGIGTPCMVASDRLQTPVTTDLFCGSNFFDACHLAHTEFNPVRPPEHLLSDLRDIVADNVEDIDIAVTLHSDPPDPTAEAVCQLLAGRGVEVVEMPATVDRLPLGRPEPEQKPRSLEELQWIARRVRDFGGTICFTNGCFDLLHA